MLFLEVAAFCSVIFIHISADLCKHPDSYCPARAYTTVRRDQNILRLPPQRWTRTQSSELQRTHAHTHMHSICIKPASQPLLSSRSRQTLQPGMMRDDVTRRAARFTSTVTCNGFAGCLLHVYSFTDVPYISDKFLTVQELRRISTTQCVYQYTFCFGASFMCYLSCLKWF